MDLQLAGKRALVTGGSRGIGKAIGRQLALEGADVAIAARTAGPLLEAADELSRSSRRPVLGVPTDTRSETDVRQLVARVTEALGGGIDVLVNAAAQPGSASGPPPGLADINPEEFLDDINVKVLGYLRCAREVVPSMLQAGWGRIINIGGMAARSSGNIVGSVRNCGVTSLGKNLADELAGSGVNVTTVHPGTTLTEGRRARMQAKAEATGKTVADLCREFDVNNAIGRMVTPEEVADVVTFLASPRSVAINGDVVAAGGGAGRSIHQ